MTTFMARKLRVGRHELSTALVAPFAVGVVVRALFSYTDNAVGPDEAAYLGTGANMWSGNGITYRGSPELHFPPLLPALLGGLARLTPEPHHATVLVTFLASVALLPILAALAFRIGGRRAGVLTLWVAALSPGLGVNLARGTGGSEALYTAVLCGAALVAVGSGRWDDRPSLPRAASVGALIGVAYLLRPEGVLISAVFGVILGVRCLGGRVSRETLTAENLRRLALTGLACVAALLVLVAPYIRYLHQNTGKWSLTAKSVDVNIDAWRALAEQDRAKRDTHLYRLDKTGHTTEQEKFSLTVLARRSPKAYLGIVGENLRQLYKSILSLNTTLMPGWRLIALPLLPFALFTLWRHRSRSTVLATAGVLGLALATVTGFFVLNRYLPPAIAGLAVFAGVGLAEITDDRRRRLWVAIGLAASVMSIATYFEGLHGPELVRERPDLQIAARWLRQNAPEGESVMTRSTALPYYMPKNKLIVPPVGTVNQVWRYARFQNVKYFIFDPTTQLWRQELAPLLDGGDHRRDGFETLHTFRVENRTTVIFKVIPRDRTPAAARQAT